MSDQFSGSFHNLGKEGENLCLSVFDGLIYFRGERADRVFQHNVQNIISPVTRTLSPRLLVGRFEDFERSESEKRRRDSGDDGASFADRVSVVKDVSDDARVGSDA